MTQQGPGYTGMHQGSGFSSGSSPVAVAGGGMMPGGAFAMGGGMDQSPPLVQQLGVSIDSLARLFRADADTEFEQPVWMVINLQVRKVCRCSLCLSFLSCVLFSGCANLQGGG